MSVKTYTCPQCGRKRKTSAKKTWCARGHSNTLMRSTLKVKTQLGSAVHRPDGKVQLNIDPEAMMDFCEQREQNQLDALRRVRDTGVGGFGFPPELLDSLIQESEKSLNRMQTERKKIPNGTLLADRRGWK